jgi:hypothetical protein
LSKRSDRPDLEKIAAQLARVKLSAIAGEDHIALRATATFATRSFTAGKYHVSVGIRQALLHLDHPSFDLENAYQATVAKETWSQSWKQLRDNHLAGSVKAKVGTKLWGLFDFSGEGDAARKSQESTEQQASAPYPIVSSRPWGWQIGTELGDPRAPSGTLPEGLEHCLNGEYLSGRQDEKGDGIRDKTGALALGLLRAKPGGNDPRIVATLFGVSGALKIVVTPSDLADAASPGLQQTNERREREDTLRKAFIEICVQRAQAAKKQGAHTEEMVSGDFYLHFSEIHAPKVPQKASSEIGTQAAEKLDEQAAPTQSKT